MLIQFGNNWMRKIPLKDSERFLRIFLIQLFPNWTVCSPITYTNHYVSQGLSTLYAFG